ncbi:methyl-accepting chemotaxis protein [Vibrio japonicus]|uniref:Methyl-accepting chemotaxis protein n=1 Tax=Vibrio japonicus TaxID=1824638 RepID=A0ABY5LKQ5_9VIBR|nr:methyl-accepting chemotaxis protein [Vibrio japonicus]UUM31357.1 methyl-accepting chemotaxis protein [Vibrio japonicus]
MDTLLRNISLHRLVMILAGVPIVLALLTAIKLVQNYQHTVEVANNDSEIIKLVLLYDNLAHNLAVERGLTAGVLGSQGDPKQVEALNDQRAVTDTHISALQAYSPTYLQSSLTDKLSTDVLQNLSTLRDIRVQVDQLSPKTSPFAYYSNLNQLSIDNASLLSSNIANQDISDLGQALIAIVKMKERAGQVRGALNGAFSRQSSDIGQYVAIENYLASGEYARRQAEQSLRSEFAAQFNQAVMSPIWKEVEQVQQQYLNQKSTLSSLEGPEPTQWFASATNRIKLINTIRNDLKTEMLSVTEQVAASASFQMNVLLALSIIITVLLVGTVAMCVQSLKKRVGTLTRQLANMSRDRNLAIELDVDGKDELSQVSKSINNLTGNLKDLLLNVTRTNESSTRSLEQMVQSSNKLGTSSQETADKCSNIATAMTELSQSSLEIASSSERALEETEQMTNKVISCQEQSQTSYELVSALVTQIEQTQDCIHQLEKDAESVSKIVDTINGISEQTNLLALNAAIEAARAGEHGRGFAVVSSEVRDLAQRSKEATEHISQLLHNITTNTQTAVQNMSKSHEATDSTFESVSVVNNSVSELESLIETVNEHITSIANSTIEQSKASEEVDKDVDVLTEIALNTGDSAGNMSNIVSNYQEEARKVNSQLQQFNLR